MRGTISLALTLLAAGLAAQTQPERPAKGALSAAEQTAAINTVREYAQKYTASLPDYTCIQTTRQVLTRPPARVGGLIGPPPRVDLIEEQLNFVNGREVRTLLKINQNQPSAAEKASVTTLSRGKFGGLLATIFAPPTGAEIHWDHAASLNGHRVNLFKYRVPQLKGYTLLESKGQTRVPFEGIVYADSRTGEVLRIEMKCVEIPKGSEYRTLELALDYKTAKIADREYLLPSRFNLHYEMTEGGAIIGAEYHAYKRFTADSTIKFDDSSQDAAAGVAVRQPAAPEPADLPAATYSDRFPVVAENSIPAPQDAAAAIDPAPPITTAPQEPKPAPLDSPVTTITPPSEPVFRTETQLVQISVIAQDKSGKPVTDLRRDEFQILDNAASREIRVFHSGQPDSSAPSPQPPGSFTNRIGSAGNGNPSVLLFDKLFIDSGNNVFKHNVHARQKASQAIKAIPPGDRIAIYALGCHFEVVREFTSDRDSLLRSLNAFRPGNAPCADSAIPTSNPSRIAPPASPGDDDSTPKMKSHEQEGYDEIAAHRQADLGEFEFKVMADHLAGIPGRKNLIWVTSEFRLSPANLQRLVEGNVAIYPVDALGSFIAPPSAKKARYAPLIAFAAITGGAAFYDNDNFDTGIRDALGDGRFSYTLGFYPEPEDSIAATHRLTVRVNRPGVTLRYRTTYELARPTVASANPVDGMVQALNRPVDATVIPLNASATRNADRLDLSVSLDVPSLDLDLSGGLWKGNVELVMRFINAEGLPVGDVSAQTLVFNLRAATYESMLQRGEPYPVQRGLPIPAKAVELKILVGNLASGKIGTLTIPLSVVPQEKVPQVENR